MRHWLGLMSVISFFFTVTWVHLVKPLSYLWQMYPREASISDTPSLRSKAGFCPPANFSRTPESISIYISYFIGCRFSFHIIDRQNESVPFPSIKVFLSKCQVGMSISKIQGPNTPPPKKKHTHNPREQKMLYFCKHLDP